MVVPLEDLPQMWQRPGYDELVAILADLELGQAVWSHRQGQRDVARSHEQEARYISSVIKSPLSWLATDEQREDVWDTAGRRMSERCGRMAVGDIVRRWPFEPDTATAPATTDTVIMGYEPFELVLREPALTGDHALGLKTWASSYVLAKQLPRLAASSLFRLFDESLGQPPPRVLELGSGTGLLGLAAAALWKVSVAMSDLPTIMPNLRHNVEGNKDVVVAKGGDVALGCLTWGSEDDAEESDQDLFGEPYQFPVSWSTEMSLNLADVLVCRLCWRRIRCIMTTIRLCWHLPSLETWRWDRSREPWSCRQ